MKEKKEKTVIQYKTERIFCNKCGSEIKKYPSGEFDDHLEVEKVWGYLSSNDGKKYSFDICESCFKKFVKTFKIPADN